jgi:hypothetical protein
VEFDRVHVKLFEQAAGGKQNKCLQMIKLPCLRAVFETREYSITRTHFYLFHEALKGGYISEVAVTISWCGERVSFVSLMVPCRINAVLNSFGFILSVVAVL